MGTVSIERISAAEARAEMSRLLDQLGMTATELREAAKNYTLSEKQYAEWRRFEALGWLASDDAE